MLSGQGRGKTLLVLLTLPAILQAELPRKAEAGFALAASKGELVIAQVRPGQNAARDGFKTGDVILRANGTPAAAESGFARPLLRRIAGDKVEFLIRREGKEMALTLEYRAGSMEHPEGLDVQYKSVETDGHQRRAFVTVPRRKGKYPAIVWIAGSGCGSQENAGGGNPQVQLLYQLTRRGFATMRVEKTGVGDSEGPPCYSESGGAAQEVRGYQAGIKTLASYDFVDPSRIYLIGHSAGATLAPLVAHGQPIHGIALAGAMGTDFHEYLMAMRRRDLELAGKKNEEIDASLAITKRCTDWLLKDRRTPDDIEKASPDCQHRVRFDSPPPYIQDWADFDLQRMWNETPDVPVLVLYGSGDFVTNEHESRALVDKINAAHPNRAVYKGLPMDHGFLAYENQRDAWDAEQGRGGGATLLSAAVDEIEHFFKKR